MKRERARQRAPSPSSLLIDTVQSAQRDILHEKDRALGRWGLAFCRGDDKALEALKAIDDGLKNHFLKQLDELATCEDLSDFRHLVDDADCARDEAVDVLIKLKQRLLAKESKAELPPSPPESHSSKTYHIPKHHRSLLPGSRPHSLIHTSTHVSEEDTASGAENGSSKKHGSILHFLKHHRAHSHDKSLTIPAEHNASTEDVRKLSRVPTSPTGSARPADFSFGGSRERSSTQQSFRWFDSFAGTVVDAPDVRQNARGHRDSLASLQTQKSISPMSTFSKDRMVSSATAFRNSSLAIRTPTPDNIYLGLCKSAVRLQNGDKKAFERRREANDSWSQSSAHFLACATSKCAFAGHIDTNEIMTKVFTVDKQGLKLRWPFLAKSHVPQQKVVDQNYVFQCLFCTFKGEPSGLFTGTDKYLEHVVEHRTESSAIILYKSKCINDHVADDEEDFDLNLFPNGPEEEQQRSRRASEMTIQSMDKMRASTEADTRSEAWNEGLSNFHFQDELDGREIG